MRKILVIAILLISASIGKAQEIKYDTLGIYEFIETFNGNSYVSEAPILIEGNYIKWHVTSSSIAPQTLEFHPDRIEELISIFNAEFASLKSKYAKATSNQVIPMNTIKASSTFTLGKPRIDLTYREVEFLFNYTLTTKGKVFGIIISIPSYEDFDDPTITTKPRTILVTEAGIEMVSVGLRKYVNK